MPGEIEKKINVGLVKGIIWKNVSKNGDQYRTVSLNKSYRQNGEWKNTNSFFEQDIDKAIEVLEQVRDFFNKAEEIVA